MTDHNERRHFQRVAFVTTALLVEHVGALGAVRRGDICDMSLNGVLFQAHDGWRGELNERYQLRLELSDDVWICMDVTIVHLEGARMGLRCDQIDLDSITALRRVLELNADDEEEIEREMDALIKG